MFLLSSLNTISPSTEDFESGQPLRLSLVNYKEIILHVNCFLVVQIRVWYVVQLFVGLKQGAPLSAKEFLGDFLPVQVVPIEIVKNS